MLANSLLRSGTVVRSALDASRRAARSYQPFPRLARYESTTTPPTSKKEALKLKAQNLESWAPPVLTYEQVKPKTQQPSPDSYLIDVREPDEVIQGSIPSSVNLPLSVLSGSLHMPPADFKAKYGFDKPKRDQEIVFYCRSGVRAATAGDVARKNGYTNLYNYRGSWLEWVQREGRKGE